MACPCGLPLPRSLKVIELLRGIGRTIISPKGQGTCITTMVNLRAFDLRAIDRFLPRKDEGINKGEIDIYYHMNIFKITKDGIVHMCWMNL